MKLAALERLAGDEAALQWGKYGQPPLPYAGPLRGKKWIIEYNNELTSPYPLKEETILRKREIVVDNIYLYYGNLYVNAYCIKSLGNRTFREEGIENIIDARGNLFVNLRSLLNDYNIPYDIEIQDYRNGLHPSSWVKLRPFAVIIKYSFAVEGLTAESRSAFYNFADWRLANSYYVRFHDKRQLEAAMVLFDKLPSNRDQYESSMRWIERRASHNQRWMFAEMMLKYNNLSTDVRQWLSSIKEC